MLSSIAIAVGSLLIGAFITYLIMSAENRSDRNDHREAYADAKVRQSNAEGVANKCSQLKQEQQRLFRKHGSVNCARCGKFSRYADSYIDRGSDSFLCAKCAAKSLDKKVQHV